MGGPVVHPRQPAAERQGLILVPSLSNLARARQRLLFARGFLANPRGVGSVIPSSPRLVGRLLGGLDWSQVRHVVEFGPGTGVVTRALLARLGPDARVTAFEINPEFAAYLARDIADPRLTVVPASAETLASHVEPGVDVAVSSLPFSIMPRHVRTGILTATLEVLAPGAPFVGYQYSTAWLKELRRFFPDLSVRFEPRNWPPAFVFTAHR